MISILKINDPNWTGAVNELNRLAFTAQPIATDKRVGISIHLLHKVVSPKARNIKMINSAKPIGELVYTFV